MLRAKYKISMFPTLNALIAWHITPIFEIQSLSQIFIMKRKKNFFQSFNFFFS
jgi:hypothetical protein